MAVVVVRVHYLGESVQTLLDSDLDEYPVNGKNATTAEPKSWLMRRRTRMPLANRVPHAPVR